jgi:hypothetical protein
MVEPRKSLIGFPKEWTNTSSSNNDRKQNLSGLIRRDSLSMAITASRTPPLYPEETSENERTIPEDLLNSAELLLRGTKQVKRRNEAKKKEAEAKGEVYVPERDDHEWHWTNHYDSMVAEETKRQEEKRQEKRGDWTSFVGSSGGAYFAKAGSRCATWLYNEKRFIRSIRERLYCAWLHD